MTSFSKKFFVVLGILLYLILDPIKLPVKGDTTGYYFAGITSVYFLEPRECGFFPCIGPDIKATRYRRIWFSDPTSFEIVMNTDNTGNTIGRDRFWVYQGSYKVRGSDPKTLKLRNGFAVDKKLVYYNGWTFDTLDPETFQASGSMIVTDMNGVYTVNTNPPGKVDIADYDSFAFESRPHWVEELGHVYASDKNFIYAYNGGRDGFNLYPKEKTVGYKPLGCRYALFNGKIYFKFYEVESADVATFRVLKSDSSYGDYCGLDTYAHDKENYFYEGKPLYIYKNEVYRAEKEEAIRELLSQ